MRLSKATLATALALALATQGASALGVIGVHARSALYEPLNVDVKIGLGPHDDFTAGSVTIADPEHFAAAGVPYPSFAHDLVATFERGPGKAKEPVLRLRSARPIYEPVVRLVIQARVGETGVVYLPVTIMLDSGFDTPLGDSHMLERLPLAGKTSSKAVPALASTPVAAAAKEAVGSKAQPERKPVQAMAAATAPAAAPKPKPVPLPIERAPHAVAKASATEAKSLADRVSALEVGQKAIAQDMASVRQKLGEVGDSVQALRDLASKASPPAPAASAPKAADPASAATAAAKSTDVPAKSTDVPAKAPEASAAAAATSPATPDSKPADAKPLDSAPPKAPDAAQEKPPSAAAEASKAADPVPVKRAPSPAFTPSPVADVEPEHGSMLPYGIGAAVLAALVAAGALWNRKRKTGKSGGAAHQSIDTDQDGVPTLNDGADTQEEPPESPVGSTHFGPKAPKAAASDASIDDLHKQIFRVDDVSDLIDSIKVDSDLDKMPTDARPQLGDLQQKVDAPRAFEMPDFNLPDAGVEAISEIPGTVVKTEAPRAGPPSAHAPMEFDSSLTFDDANATLDTLDLTSIDFGGGKEPDAALVHAPAPAPSPIPEIDKGFAMAFESIEPIHPAEPDTMKLDDAFTQAMNMAKSTEARSAGQDMGKRFVISPSVEESHGRLQLELACLYAQSTDWDSARSTLKEVISDEDMQQVHPEARRLMAMLP